MPKLSRRTEEQAERVRAARDPETDIRTLIAGLYDEIRELRNTVKVLADEQEERKAQRSTPQQSAHYNNILNEVLQSQSYDRSARNFLTRTLAWLEAYGHLSQKQMTAIDSIVSRTVLRKLQGDNRVLVDDSVRIMRDDLLSSAATVSKLTGKKI